MIKNITNLVRGTVLARHWIKEAKIRLLFSLIFSLMLVMSNATPFVQIVSAAPGNFSIDFTAAAPLSYNHLTGGGAFDDGTIGVGNDVVESLEGGSFSCGDIVTYFAVVTVDDTQQATTDAPQTIEMNFSFLADTTGQSGAALGDIVNVTINYGTIEDLIPGENITDEGIIDDGSSVATLTSETLTGPLFQKGSLLLGTVELTDLEAGEQVVVRIDVKLFCKPGSSPTGNLQADLQDSRLTYINGTTPVTPPQAIPGGAQTIPFQKIGDIEAPEIAIQKTVTTEERTCPGVESLIVNESETFKYCYVVTNTGTAPLYNVTVIDDASTPSDPADDFNVALSGLTDIDLDGAADDLASGSTATGTKLFNYSTTGTFINTANATGVDSIIQPTVLSDNDTATVIIEYVQNPACIIEKTVTDVAGKGDSANVTKAGDVISYQISVTNTGNVDLTNITVNDTLIETLNGPSEDSNDQGVLNVRESWIFTGNYKVTQADINNNGGGDGDIDNTVTVDSDELEPESDTAQVPIARAPAYTINKIVTDVAGKGDSANVTKAGDIISYRINVTNTGNVDLTNVTITDPLIGTLTRLNGENPVTGVLEVGETWIFTGNYKVTQADINTNGGGDGFINNMATVDSDQLGPKSDSAEVPIEQKLEKPDYCIYKSIIGADRAGDCIINEPGDIIEYQIAVKNIGKVKLTNVTVNDSLIKLIGPAGDDIDPGVLNPGETWKYAGNYTVTKDDINSNGGGDGDIDNTATVSSNELPDESSSVQQPITRTPDYCIYKSIIGVDKAGDCIINEPGDIIEYQIAVKNEGNADLTGISVNDKLIKLKGPTGDKIEPGILNPGETWKYTGNYTVTQGDINSNGGGDGDIDNTATVSSNELPDESSSKEQPIVQKLDLCIYKSIIGVDKAGDCMINEPGDIIEYQIAVKNNGKGNLTGVSVSDPLITLIGPAGDDIDPGVLNPGETWKYAGNYTVTKDDINSNGGGDGDIDNTATVSSNELPDESSSVQQPITRTPDYCIYKSIIGVDKAGDCIINEPGDIIEYQIAVKNEGNADLTGISVNDKLIKLKGPTGDKIEPGILNPGETWKYTGNYTVTKDDINSNGGGEGDIDNTATVSSNELPDESSSKEQMILLTSIFANKNVDSNTTPTNDADQNGNDDSGESSSSGASGGGVGGGSPEPASNVKVKEISQVFIANGNHIIFDFPRNATDIVYLSFDSKKTAGKTTTIIEMLKDQSTLTPDTPQGEVYTYLNIWVGNGEYASSENIEDPVICFKVEKSWIKDKDIDQSSIILNRYNDYKWSELPTTLLREDDRYLYFKAETPGFSPFAITGQTKNGLDASMRGMQSESDTNNSGEDTGLETTEDTGSGTRQKGSLSTPGFELVYGIISLLAIFLYRRR